MAENTKNIEKGSVSKAEKILASIQEQTGPKPDCNFLLDGDIKRDENHNLIINIKSPVDFSFLYIKSAKHIFDIGGVKCFMPKRDMLGGVNGSFVCDNVYECNNYPNLALLLAPNLDKGVQFNFEQVPISDAQIEQWKNRFGEQIRAIFLNYYKPYGVTMKFTAETIVKQEHH